MEKLPFYAQGPIVKGFGRGSKELGIPTANFPQEVVDGLPPELPTGVYYGFAQVDSSPVYKMVMSIGWNPFYHNEIKSMETHILNVFPGDLYGQNLKVAIVGYLRAQTDFKGVDELIQAIKQDIQNAEEQLEKEDNEKYRHAQIFTHFL